MRQDWRLASRAAQSWIQLCEKFHKLQMCIVERGKLALEALNVPCYFVNVRAGIQLVSPSSTVRLTWDLIGSVLTWHIYEPLSFSWTCEMCNFHVLCPLCVTDSLGFKATMCVWIAKIAFESDLIHATCNERNKTVTMAGNCKWNIQFYGRQRFGFIH